MKLLVRERWSSLLADRGTTQGQHSKLFYFFACQFCPNNFKQDVQPICNVIGDVCDKIWPFLKAIKAIDAFPTWKECDEMVYI
jgi:hypothetical protein